MIVHHFPDSGAFQADARVQKQERLWMCNHTTYSLVDQWEEQQVSSPQKSNFSLEYTNQSLLFILCPKHKLFQTPLWNNSLSIQDGAKQSAQNLDLHYCFLLWNVFYSDQKATAKRRGMGTRSINKWANAVQPWLDIPLTFEVTDAKRSIVLLFIFSFSPPPVSCYMVWLSSAQFFLHLVI